MESEIDQEYNRDCQEIEGIQSVFDPWDGILKDIQEDIDIAAITEKSEISLQQQQQQK